MTTIPASDYGALSLSERSVDDRKHSRAIADLTDPNTEKFLWLPPVAPDLSKKWIAERIFWLSLDQLLDDKQLPKLLGLIQKHAAFRPDDYVVKVGIAGIDMEPLSHPLDNPGNGTIAVGHHIELRGEDSVGGYVTSARSSDRHYIFVTDFTGEAGKLYDNAKRYYAEHAKHTFTVPAQPLDDQPLTVTIRQELNKLANIGTFEPHWGRHSTRSSDYFQKYEYNIATWITRSWYTDLNKICGQGVIRELFSCFNRDTNIVEVGFGTGNMTKWIVEWIAEQRRLAQNVSCPQPSRTFFYGIDEASEMCKRARDRFRENLAWCEFYEGEFSEYLEEKL